MVKLYSSYHTIPLGYTCYPRIPIKVIPGIYISVVFDTYILPATQSLITKYPILHAQWVQEWRNFDMLGFEQQIIK